MEEENRKDWCEETLEKTEEQIKSINEQGINSENISYLSELVDIHKDLKNEEYWKEKLEMKYRYGNYENYNEGGNYGEYGRENYGRRSRDSRGRYNARGYDSKYRGDEMMNAMYQDYGEYSENRDNYGADQSTLQSLDKMLQSASDFFKMLKQEAKSQEEVEMIKQTAREISEM